MKLFNIIMFTASGVLIYLSVLLPKLGLIKSLISHRSAVVLSGVGAGIGVSISVFFGFSNGDFFGSCFTGFIVAFTAGLVFHYWNK